MQVTIDRRPAVPEGNVQQSVTFTVSFMPVDLATICPCEDKSEAANSRFRRIWSDCPMSELEKLELAMEMAHQVLGIPPDQTAERINALTDRLDTSEGNLSEEVDKSAASGSGENG